MINIAILENHDIILATDWCRPLHIVSMSGGYSDYYSFESHGRPDNNAKWARVDRVLSNGWIGDTVGGYRAATAKFHDTEFARGDIPLHHQCSLTEYELKKAYEYHLSNMTISVSKKHRGKSALYVLENDPTYYGWAVRENLAPDFLQFKRDYYEGLDRIQANSLIGCVPLSRAQRNVVDEDDDLDDDCDFLDRWNDDIAF